MYFFLIGPVDEGEYFLHTSTISVLYFSPGVPGLMPCIYPTLFQLDSEGQDERMHQVGLDPAEGVQTEIPGLQFRYKTKVHNRRSHIPLYTTKVTQEHWEPGHPMAPVLIAGVWNSPSQQMRAWPPKVKAMKSMRKKQICLILYRAHFIRDKCTD